MAAITELFRGYEAAYGTYTLDEQDTRADGKRKGQALTLREPVTKDLWQSHLSGVKGLGIIPIRETNDCYWGCIDIDVYKNFMPETIVTKIRDLGLPLWVFRSKSGGCHVVAFVSQPIPAQELRDWLKEVASAIGYAKSEIFPKQVHLQPDNLGNWLNMPYFNSTSTMRFAYDPTTGTPLSLEEFESSCEPLPAKDLLGFKLEVHLKDKGGKKNEFGEAPPCLEQLCLAGQYPEGSRNTGLLNLAAFRRKSIEDDERFEGAVFADNRKYMGPGSDNEVKQVIRSLRKKAYEYQCDLEPLASHCNRALCQTRRFGVAHHQATLTGLQKIASEPPIWILQVDDHEVRLTTESFQSQILFQRAVMEQTNLVPIPRKPHDWTLLLRQLLSKVQIIEMPLEATREGYLVEMIEEYLSSAAPATNESQIHQGVPIEEGGRSFFKVTSLFAWLHDHGFRDIHSNRAHYLAMMKKMEQLEVHPPRRVAGRSVRLWSIGSPVRVEIISPEEDIPF